MRQREAGAFSAPFWRKGLRSHRAHPLVGHLKLAQSQVRSRLMYFEPPFLPLPQTVPARQVRDGRLPQHRAEVRLRSPGEPARTSAPSGASSLASKLLRSAGVLALPCPRSRAPVLRPMHVLMRDAAPHLSQRRFARARPLATGDLDARPRARPSARPSRHSRER